MRWLRQGKYTPWLVLALYMILTVVMTWPVAGRLGTHIPGKGGDTWVHLWNFVWAREALGHWPFTFETTLIFFPDGVSMLNSNVAWVQFLFWWPLQALLGITVAYSLMFLATIVFNGWAMYWLAREVTESETAAFVAGLIVGFWPYTLSHHSHPNGLLIGWIPLALLFLRRLLMNGRRWDVLWAGVCLALVGYGRWQHLLMSSLLIGFYGLYVWSQQPRSLWLGRLKLWGWSVLLAVCLMAPLLVPTLLNQQRESYLQEHTTASQTNLLAYVLPNRYHPLWGEWAYERYLANGFGVNLDFIPFVGYTTLFLVLIGFIWRKQQSWFWLVGAGLYLLLALGGHLQVGERVYDMPLPYQLIEGSQVDWVIRHPDRFNYFLGIPLAMVAAWGVLVGQRKLGKWGGSFFVGLCVLLVGEYVVQYVLLPADIPDWYEGLMAEGGTFGVLGVPMGSRTNDKTYMYYQTQHGKALVGGHVSREPETAVSFLQSTPLLAALWQVGDEVPAVVDVSHQLQLLTEANVRYLIVDKDALPEEKEVAWKAWVGAQPYHEDDHLIVYRLDEMVYTLSPRDLFGGLQLLEAEVWPETAGLDDWIMVTTRWHTTMVLGQVYELCLQLLDDVGEMKQKKCQALSEDLPTDQWQADGIFRPAPYRLQLSSYLDGGNYELWLVVRDADGQQLAEAASIGSVTLPAINRTFARPVPTREVKATWGEEIDLVGYDLKQEEGGLTVRIYWQALQRMARSYKLFVHLIDPVTNEIVSQVDMIPGNWGYPTTWWEVGEYVSDEIGLSLEGVSAGRYNLYVGFYDEGSGERLPVYDGEERPFVNESALLTEVIR